jgi:hypothetical protein
MVPDPVLLDRALGMLDGVGDATLGAWTEKGGHGVWHVRRRLTDAERIMLGHPMTDIRRTPEALQRWQALPRQAQAQVPPFVIRDEVGELV